MRTDIQLDENMGLVFKDGDFAVGSSAQQEAMNLILSQKGEWKENPQVGMGADRYIKKRVAGMLAVGNMPQFKRDTKLALEADGLVVKELVVSEDLSMFKLELNEG